MRNNPDSPLRSRRINPHNRSYSVSEGRIIKVGCWAHARRKFHERRRLDPVRMETALAWIGKLYAVEKNLRQRCEGEWKHITLDQRAARIATALGQLPYMVGSGGAQGVAQERGLRGDGLHAQQLGGPVRVP
jgi:Transposase IS66 family